MPRPLVGNRLLKALVGQFPGWGTAIGPRVNVSEGAPSTGTPPTQKYLLPISTQSLRGQADGTSTATGSLKVLVAITGTANGTSTASGNLDTFEGMVGTANGTSTATGNLILLVFAPIEGTANGTSTASASLHTLLPPRSPSDAVGPPARMRLVPVPTPATAADEGIFFVSDGTLGLNAGEAYWRPESSGTPVSLYDKPLVEDLADTLIFGDFTGGSDIRLTNGDFIRSENSGIGIPGRPVILAPGSTVDTDVGALVWGSQYAFEYRGKAAIDMQFGRESSTDVVQPGSDYAAIVGGRYHVISGTSVAAGIFGGDRNVIGGNSPRSVILGGSNNLITYRSEGPGPGPSHAVMVGGEFGQLYATNGLSSNGTFVHHGFGPSPIYNTMYSAFVGTGFVSVADAGVQHAYLFVCGVVQEIHAAGTTPTVGTVVFGRLNDAFGAYDSGIMGRFCRVGNSEGGSASNSLAGGNFGWCYSSYTVVWGINSTADGDFSALFGYTGRAPSSHQLTLGSGNIGGANEGASEWARRTTTVGATSAPMTALLYITGCNGFEILLTARQTGGSAGTVGDSAMWLVTGFIKSIAGVTTLVGVPTGTGTPSAFFDAGAALWSITVTADDVNDVLAITVTGETNKNISWTASVKGAEVG